MYQRLKLSPPDDWQDFERLCFELWKEIWKDPEAERNGRQGQPQCGVDIYGNPGRRSKWHGIQCKQVSNSLTEEVINREVKKAIDFTPPLSNFIIATTDNRSSNIQRIARHISEKNENKGLFPVTVLGWEDIVERLYEHPNVLNRWYSEAHGNSKSEYISGYNPFTIYLEVIPALDGHIVNSILNDFEEYVLTEKCKAVLFEEPNDPILKQKRSISESKSKILDHINRVLSNPSGAFQHIVKWEMKNDSNRTIEEIYLSTSGPHLLLRMCSYHKGLELEDCTSVKLSEYFKSDELVGSEKFQAFPSIHGDIRDRINYYMMGDMLGHAVFFGFEKVIFPEKYHAAPKVLELAIDKMIGNTISGCSEITLGDGRAFIIHDKTMEEAFPWIMSYVILPIGEMSHIDIAMDVISILIQSQFVYNSKGGVPRSDSQKKIIKEFLANLNSKPFSNGGAFEQMLEDKDKIFDHLDEDERVKEPGNLGERFKPYDLPQNPQKVDLYKAIAQELRISSGNNLIYENVIEEEKENYTQVMLVLKIRSGEPCNDDKPGERFFKLINKLKDLLSNSKNIHSVRHQPLLLTDALLWVLKINWNPHPDEEINMFY